MVVCESLMNSPFCPLRDLLLLLVTRVGYEFFVDIGGILGPVFFFVNTFTKPVWNDTHHVMQLLSQTGLAPP